MRRHAFRHAAFTPMPPPSWQAIMPSCLRLFRRAYADYAPPSFWLIFTDYDATPSYADAFFAAAFSFVFFFRLIRLLPCHFRYMPIRLFSPIFRRRRHHRLMRAFTAFDMLFSLLSHATIDAATDCDTPYA